VSGHCEIHGLAAAPDGRCVICRREAGGANPWTRPIVWIAIVGAAAIAVSSAAAYHFTRNDDPAPVVVASAPPAREPARLVARPRPPLAPRTAPANTRDDSARPDEPPPLLAPVVIEDDSAAEAAARAAAEAEAVAVARRRVSIVMYSTSWCPSCTSAREWFNAQGISFVEHDIESSDLYRERMRRLNPRGSIPTISIDDRAVLVGFSPGAIATAIDDAARRRARL
jgi:glutaredoxin